MELSQGQGLEPLTETLSASQVAPEDSCLDPLEQAHPCLALALLTSCGPSCSRSADALSEAASESHPAAPHGNGWSAQPWLAARCLRTKGQITAEGGKPGPCPWCGATRSPYLPGQCKAGTSHQLQTPVLVNHHQPGALGHPGRARIKHEHGQGSMGWQAEGGSCLAL